MTPAALANLSLLTLLGGALSAFLLSRSRTGRVLLREPPPWLDVALVVVLLIIGAATVQALHALANPGWSPFDRDWYELWTSASSFIDSEQYPSVANRYPLYPWLGFSWARMTDQPVCQALMQLALLFAGLLPAVLFLAGRHLAPRPVAFAASLLPLHCQALLNALGVPSEQVLNVVLWIACVGAGSAALQRGGRARFLVFGTCLALYMASAPAALIQLTLAVPLAVVGIAWHGRARVLRAAQATVLFALPLIVAWQAVGRLDWDLLSLERIVYTAQWSEAAQYGYDVPLPAGFDETALVHEHGHWRVGDIDALRHLPETYAFFLGEDVGNVPLQVRRRSVVEGLVDPLPAPFDSPGTLLLLVPACMALGSMQLRRGTLPWRCIPRGLVLVYGASSLAVHLRGLVGTMYVERYALAMAALLPMLLVGGAVAVARWPGRPRWRRAGLPWWPLAAVLLAYHSFGDAELGRADALAHAESLADQRAVHPLYGLLHIRYATGLVVVVDLSGATQVPSLVRRTDGSYPNLTYDTRFAACEDGTACRRFLLLPCLFEPTRSVPWEADLAPARYRAIGPCIYEDLDPQQELLLSQGS